MKEILVVVVLVLAGAGAVGGFAYVLYGLVEIWRERRAGR